MDLLSFTAGAIDAVNARVPLIIKVSTGNTTQDDGAVVPTYADPIQVVGEVQPLSSKDLRQIEGLNLQGTLHAIYLYGHFNGIVRPTMKGGDLITEVNGSVWLVNQVLEHWPDWTKVVATLQNRS